MYHNAGDDLVFLVELLTRQEERSLASALRADPLDDAARAAYADWLEQEGRFDSARLVLGGYVPGRDPTRPISVWPGVLVASGTIFSGAIFSGQIGRGIVASGGFR